jgi:hypothetical protein
MDQYNINGPQLPAPAGTAEADRPEASNWSDVALFHEALTAPAPTSGLPQRALEPALARLAALADRQQQRVHQVEVGFVKAAHSADPVQMYRLNKEYSELMLDTELAMKVVGKTTAAIEQLERLQ